jgi:hypothetical protein
MMAYTPGTVKRLARAVRSVYNSFPRRQAMEKMPLTEEEIARLRRREADILVRIDRLKATMNETKAIDTLAFKAKLFKEAQEELRHVQDKLAGLADE